MNATPAPFERILLPTDFSGFSSMARRHALALARRFKARLKVVGLPDVYSSGDAKPAFLRPDAAEARKMAERETFHGPRPAGIDYELEIREETPGREILAAAWVPRTSLMGTHGRSGAERFLLGSVAEAHAPPSLPGDDGAPRGQGRAWETPGGRILCATDFSENSERAFRFSLALASTVGARVALLHSIEHMPDLGEARYRMVVPDVEPLMKEIERAASERLGQAVDALAKESAGVEVTARLGAGRAYQEIVRVAEDERADLIVVGAQSHGVFEHVVSGSNAQVIRRATCPVLTVRPQTAVTAHVSQAGAGSARLREEAR